MKKILVFTVLIFTLAGCVGRDDVLVRGVSTVDLRLPSAVNLIVDAENRSAHNVTLLSCQGDLYYRGSRIAAVILPEAVTLPKRFAGEVPVTIRLRISDPLAAYAVMNNIPQAQHQITVTGQAQVKAGWMKKKIEFREVPLSQLIATFVPSE